jgi:ATP-dependent Clp endopeptidase proteolytic subunit ClpP
MREWYSIKAAADSSEAVEVYIFDVIGDWGWGDGVSAKSFINDIQQHRGKKLNVLINSPGGAVTDGLAIYNYLSQRGNVDTSVIGVAASIASVIALAGDQVSIAENGLMMVHNPSGIAFGDSAEMRKTADVLDVFKGSLVRTYQAETGAKEKQVTDWMDAETWFSAQDALDAGFVDSITGPVQAAAHADLSKFKNYKSLPPSSATPKPKPMSALSKLFGGPSARETFLVSVVTALGVTEEQLAAAEKEGKPDFVVTALAAKVEEIKAENLKLTTDLATAKADHKAATDKIAELEKKAVTVPIKAQELLGNMGVPAPLPKDNGAAVAESDEELVKTFNALHGKARSQFYLKHQARIKRIAETQDARN